MKFTVHICQHWDERFPVEVNARSVKQAIKKATELSKDKDFNWNNAEMSERRVMGVDDANGDEVYADDSPHLGDLLERVDRFLTGFEDDGMQEGINELIADVRKAKAAQS